MYLGWRLEKKQDVEKMPVIPCVKQDGRFPYPEYVCIPQAYGSTSYTSDYDVGINGPGAGKLVNEFNNHFITQFGMSSEDLLDANVYAFSIEYAMPQLFIRTDPTILTIMVELDADKDFQMQELAVAIFKVIT